jgi:hypothetical protein
MSLINGIQGEKGLLGIMWHILEYHESSRLAFSYDFSPVRQRGWDLR